MTAPLETPGWKAIPWAVSAVAVFLFSISSNGYVGGDEGSYFYEARLIREGRVPMKDFVSRAPAQMYLLSLYTRVSGDNLTALKAFNILIVLMIVALTYEAIRPHQSKLLAWIASLLLLLNPAFFLSKLVLNTTPLSIFFVLAACQLLRLGTTRGGLLAGASLALAVFTRETNAVFVVVLLGFLAGTRRWMLLRDVVAGGAAISAVFVGFFTVQIGFGTTLRTVLGVGHLSAAEVWVEPVHSFRKFGFFLLSIAPLPACLLFLKGRAGAAFQPERLALASASVFYTFYSFKRGFLLSYGSELIPFLLILVFTTREFRPSFYARRAVAGTWAALLLLPLSLFLFVAPPAGSRWAPSWRISLDALIGSGVPRPSFDEVDAVVRTYTRPGETILTGTPLLALTNRLNQFLSITRVLIYEHDSSLDAMYGAPSREAIAAAFTAQPPPVVVRNSHLDATLWRIPAIRDGVRAWYTSAYRDEFTEVFVRNERLRKSR